MANVIRLHLSQIDSIKRLSLYNQKLQLQQKTDNYELITSIYNWTATNSWDITIRNVISASLNSFYKCYWTVKNCLLISGEQ